MALLSPDFPTLDAALNGASAILLASGYLSIRRKKVLAHKCCMLAAFFTSCVFLFCYLWYHLHHGIVHFSGQGRIRTFYFVLLGTHSTLATVIVPLVLITLYLALRGWFDRHRKIARWTFPIWMYVSITGVMVYWMLFHLYAPR
ncbi:MAG: DUF420 domain-containing protein [Terriglobia bacterium]